MVIDGGESAVIGGETVANRWLSVVDRPMAGILHEYCNAGRSKHPIQPETRRGGTTDKKVFCADHLLLSAGQKRSLDHPHRAGVQTITVPTGNRLGTICGPLSGVYRSSVSHAI